MSDGKGLLHLARTATRPSSREASKRWIKCHARAEDVRGTGWMPTYGILTCLLLLSFGFGVPAKAESFVATRGTEFILDGQPFYVTGVNNHYVGWGSKAEVDRVLDAAVAMGANVIRTILGPAIGAPGEQDPKTIWDFKSTSNSYELNTHGVYLLYWDSKTKTMAINGGANGIGRIDYLVAAAAQRHLKLLFALVDNWSFIGDMPQMDAWYGSTDLTGFFFSDPRTVAD